MGNIIVGFSRPSAKFPPPLFSWLIRLVDWSSFSHTYIRFNADAYQRNVVFQASGLKLNLIGWAMFQAEEVIVREFSLSISDEAKLEAIQYAFDNAGLPYALGEVLGLLAVKIARLFGYKIKNPVSQRGDYCSELVAIMLKDFENAPFTSDQVKCMEPTDVYDYLETVTAR